MTNLFLFIISACFGFITYMLYISIFVPAVNRDKLIKKLSKKEVEDLEVRLGIKNYFGIDREKESRDIVKKIFTKAKIIDKVNKE